MASENTKRLYAHYLTVPTKARHAAELLKKFPELKQNGKKDDKEMVGETDKEQPPEEKEKVSFSKKKKE